MEGNDGKDVFGRKKLNLILERVGVEDFCGEAEVARFGEINFTGSVLWFTDGDTASSYLVEWRFPT